MAHRRHSPARRKSTRKSWFAMGALLGALPPLRLGAQSTPPEPALPVEHRIVLDRRKVEAALAHVKIWTPSETLLDGAGRRGAGSRECRDARVSRRAFRSRDRRTGRPGLPLLDSPGPARAGAPSVRIDHRLHGSRRARSARQSHDRRGNRHVDRGAGARSAAVRHEPVVPRRRREDLCRGGSPVRRRRPGHGRVGETELRQVHGAAHRDAADDPGHSPDAARRAGRNDPDRRAAQRAGHHHAGR